MARQPRWVAAGVYQPTYKPRHAYGPRRWGRAEIVEEVAHLGGVWDARDLARYGNALGTNVPQLVYVPMPRGGRRALLVCPRCQRHATRLYERYHKFFRKFVAACRVCWGMRYQSQYAGRRIEAHPDYLLAVTMRQIDKTPREPRGSLPVPARYHLRRYRHLHRMRRYEQAQAIGWVRDRNHAIRSDLALTIALATLVAHSEAKHRRKWRKIVNQVLWPGHVAPHLPTLRTLIAGEDTPAWARTLFQQALERAEMGEKTPKTALKRVKLDELSQDGEQVRIDELRAAYAALSLRRRAA